MTSDLEILKKLFNSFDPSRPLPAGDPKYVDCREVRGDGDILEELGREIIFSERLTCQLYSGHRGAGKSTELLRLQQDLDSKGYFVIYFAADEEDIDSEDAQYTDILLACTRHLLDALKNSADPQPLLDWLKDRWNDLKDLALTEVSLESLSIEAQLHQFAKLTANLRAVPSVRQKIRERIDPHTTTLIKALNEFIREGKKKLPEKYSQLLVIADNLDRIVPVIQEDGRSNHDHIFLDRHEQLKALECHLVYTVPISMLYLQKATDLRNNYDGENRVLPMIMVKTPDNVIYQPGLNKLKEVIAKRVNQVIPDRALETEIFDSPQTLEQICLMSGGHVRELLLLLRVAVKQTDKLPIPVKAVQRAITEARDNYRRSVQENQWQALAKVYHSKRIINDDLHRSLLFNRCLLEYRYLDGDEIKRWYDVHPLIKGIEEFKEACQQISWQKV
ncbi:pilus assembly protein PilB [[Phormidium ambiguum] IAM M-71]|uniref:Pilus assembly protein PilB n=1 Tax=[Phormidium ambiguum] IAM M-71 TaxID=454136 RepID=A0A1U7I6H1_9CYAN|nr:AAA family ATPase [Phormidium ambiguum]OKH31893.1 pilus assembly protein PilB [Phormidium ambiguum IAM M-71]